jgi:hypothetical protein
MEEKETNPEPDAMQVRQWEDWEHLRMHAEYRKLCEGIKFLPKGKPLSGTIDPTWAAVAENRHFIEKRRRRIKAIFRISGILDPERSYDELPPGAVGEVSRASVTEGGRDLRSGEILQEGRYLSLTVDVMLPWDEIKQMVKAYVRLQRAMAEVKPTRTRFEEAMEALKVYKLKEADRPELEIIKELWPDEFEEAQAFEAAKVSDEYAWAQKEFYGRRANSKLTALYQRVRDKYKSAKNSIEEFAKKK